MLELWKVKSPFLDRFGSSFETVLEISFGQLKVCLGQLIVCLGQLKVHSGQFDSLLGRVLKVCFLAIHLGQVISKSALRGLEV